MPKTEHSIPWAGKSIPFQLGYSNRKSLEIAVHPDGSVLVKAPLGADESIVVHRVHRRAPWIERQLRYFAQFDPRTPKRRFVGGETHLYLGRKYRLKIKCAETDGVALRHGYFHITTTDRQPAHIAQLLNNWYRSRANIRLPQILDQCWPRFQHSGAVKPTIAIRTMKTRWGSLSKRGKMTLNLALIKVSQECIEYVVVHELCHLLHPNHGKEFYGLLEAHLPDWKARKKKLEKTLA